MKEKKIIGIDINNIFRVFDENIWFYCLPENNGKFIDLIDLDKFCEFMGFESTWETYFDFSTNKETLVEITKNEKLKNFISERAFDIFGKNSNKTSTHIFFKFSNLMKNLSNKCEFLLFSYEQHPIIGNTLSFLSVNPTNCGKYILNISKYDEIYKHCDIVVSTNPNILNNSKNKKNIVVFEKEYNKHIKCQNKISNFDELENIIKKMLKITL